MGEWNWRDFLFGSPAQKATFTDSSGNNFLAVPQNMQYGKDMGYTFSPEKAATTGFFSTDPEKPGMGIPALQTLGSLGTIYTGLQNNKIARENLAFQKQQWADQMKRYGEERDYNIASVNNARLAGSGMTGAGSRRPQQLTIG